MKYPKYRIFIVLIFSISLASFAQDTISTTNQDKANSWTMEFGIASNFTLTSFQGTSISISRYLSDYQKIRIGVSTSLNTTSNKSEERSYYADTLFYKVNNKSDNSINSIQFTVQHLTYASPNTQTSFYFAIGPLAGVTWNSIEIQREDLTAGNNQWRDNDSESQNEYFVGILGSCGVEWFFSQRIPLHAEYGIAGLYNWSKDEATLKYQTTNNSTATTSINRKEYSSSTSIWTLKSQNILFGLSVVL